MAIVLPIIAAALLSSAIYCYVKTNEKVALLRRLNPSRPDLIIIPFYFPARELWARIYFPDWLSPFPLAWALHPKDFLYSKEEGKDQAVFVVAPDMITLYVAEEEMIHEIYDKRQDFVKPIQMYKILEVFGRNIVTTNDELWKQHRKIVSPTFSEKNNSLVFDVTLKTVNHMISTWVEGGLQEPVDFTTDTFNVALNVISGAAFGKELDWKEDITQVKAGHSHTFKKALQRMVSSLPIYVISPKFLFKLPIHYFQDMEQSIKEFDQYMHELIVEEKGKEKGDNNILSAMVHTSEENSLNDREILGNLFILLFAGHETTAATLSFAFASLALNPTFQDRLVDEIKAVCGDCEPEFAHLNQMPYTLAILNETLRLYGPVPMIPKWTTKEARLKDLVIPPLTSVSLHGLGAHYSAKTWGPDAAVFNPARWFVDPACAASASACTAKAGESLKSFLKTHRYSFLPFSDGPRSCIGKRFAEVEFMCCLIAVIQRFAVAVPKGVTMESLLEFENIITVHTIRPVKLVVKKR